MNLEKVVKAALKEVLNYDAGFDYLTYDPVRERNYEGFYDLRNESVSCNVCGWKGKESELILDNNISVCPRCEGDNICYGE